MIAIAARIVLNPAHVEAFIAEATKLVAPTLKEPGCTWYSFARDICEPNVLRISEEWESEDHLQAHLRAPHIKAFLAAISTLELLEMVSRQYEVTSVGPVSLPAA